MKVTNVSMTFIVNVRINVQIVFAISFTLAFFFQ